MNKKFIPLIIGFIVSILLFVLIFVLHLISLTIGMDLIPKEYIYAFIPLIPGPMLTDVILLYLFPILIYYVINRISPGVIQFVYKINKVTFILRKKPEYGFINVGEKFRGTRIFFRAFLINLFAFGTSAVLYQLFLYDFGEFFRASFGDPLSIPPGLYAAEVIFFATFFLASLSLLLFLPSWYMEDAGFVAYRHFPELRKTPIIEGVHKFYINFLEVYTGFSTIATLYQVVVNAIPAAGFGPALLTPIIVIILPLILTGLLAVPIYLYEKNMEQNQIRIHTKFSKYNLKHFKIPTFNQLEETENR